MNKAYLLIAAGIFIFNSSFIQAQPSGIILKVKRQASRRQNRVNYRFYDGTEDKDMSRSLELKIMARNVGSQKIEGEIEWFFLAKGMNTKTVWIFDQDYAPIILTPMGKTNIIAESEPIESHINGWNRKSGNTIAGYIVRVVSQTNVLEIKASLKAYESIAKDHVKFRALLEKSESKKANQQYYRRWQRDD